MLFRSAPPRRARRAGRPARGERALARVHPAERDGQPELLPDAERDGEPRCVRLLDVHGGRADGGAGILPRDGRKITFKDLNNRCRETFNFSPTFSFYVPHYAATMLERNYWTDTFDLADISAHNCIEHDASLCRASRLLFFPRYAVLTRDS